MKNRTKEIPVIFKLLMLLSQLLLVVARPTVVCSQTLQIERYDPSDPRAEKDCVKCPECPEGQGLSPQCGSRITKDIKIECKPCQVNKTYSDSHGIESCKACQECGLKNVIEHCTPNQNRKCGTKCPQGYFLDHNRICQECYFCCDNVSEAGRRQGCKDIGMDKTWRCERTEQNQQCKEALEKLTTKPTGTTPTVPPDLNTMTDKHLKTQVPGNTRSQNSPFSGSTAMASQETKVARLPINDDSANTVLSTNALLSTQKEKEQDKHGAESLRVVIGVVTIIAIISVLALISTKRVREFCRSSRTELAQLADSTELIPLQSMCEPTDSGRSSPQDSNSTNDVSGKEASKPNRADTIPEGCLVSEMEQLRDNERNLMLFCVKNKLDALETPTRKTWRGVGQALGVSSEELDLIEIDYKADRSPTESLLTKLKNFPKEPTMREFVDALIICDRHDVANFICSWPWEKLFAPVNSEHPCEMVHQAARDNKVEVG